MSKVYTKNILLFIIVFTLPLLCAEQPSSSSWFNFSSTSLPNASQFNLATVSNYVTTKFGSLAATTVNAISDEAALIKIGYPPHNELAIKEAERNKEIYKTIEDKKYQSLDQVGDLSRFLERRVAYLMRIYSTLPFRPDGLDIAQHCLLYHAIAMDKLRLDLFNDFIIKTKQHSIEVSKVVSDFQNKKKDEEGQTNVL